MLFRTGKRSADSEPWKVTEATITSCRPQLFSGDTVSDSGELATTTYKVEYEYEVDGKSYSGTFRRESPAEEGHTFELSYDPASPSRNTASDTVFHGTNKLLVWIFGAALIGLLIYIENR